MLIGHVDLAPESGDAGEGLVVLVAALDHAGVRQHVLVSDAGLAGRIAAMGGPVLGPLVRSPVMACCLMPRVDVVHVHETAAGKTGLLLTLTRSIPYVLTHDEGLNPCGNPLLQSIYRRAAAVVCRTEDEAALLRHSLPGIAVVVIPDVDNHGAVAQHLRLYQNSQRMPMAGSRGIQ